MDYRLITVSLFAALLAGFAHGALGMGFGMIAMSMMTLVAPYNNASAIVSVALMILIVQVVVSLKEDVCWKEIIAPSTALTAGKIIGIVAMMSLQSTVLKILFGLFLIIYSVCQLLQVKALQICGTSVQGIVFGFIGGLFGGLFNSSGPAVSIYSQARYGNDPKKYSANMNAIFLPSAFIALIMHYMYGNFTVQVIPAILSMAVGVLVGTYVGIKLLKKIKAPLLRKISYIYIIIMGILIFISK